MDIGDGMVRSDREASGTAGVIRRPYRTPVQLSRSPRAAVRCVAMDGEIRRLGEGVKVRAALEPSPCGLCCEIPVTVGSTRWPNAAVANATVCMDAEKSCQSQHPVDRSQDGLLTCLWNIVRIAGETS